MESRSFGARRAWVALAGVIAVAGAVVVLAVPAAGESHAPDVRMHDHVAAAPVRTAKAIVFHDRMRALWEEHGSWTRMVIVSFVGNLPNLPAAEQVLLDNQVKIGDAVKPYYGRAAGNELTKLLKAHILGAVNLLVAAKSGDPAKLKQAETAWYANGRQIGDFLHAANPRHLSRAASREMMKVHLDQVIEQAVDELQGKYAAGAQAFGPYIRHILDMADMISGGIIQQFPAKFR
jgi:hypothetical protein